MGEYPPDHNQANWHPEREQQPEKTFSILLPPEMQDGWNENINTTENGQPLKREIKDELGRVRFKHETSYLNDQTASPETKKSDWQRFTDEFDGQGRALKERSQKLMPDMENTTSLEHQYDDEAGTHTTTGRIEAGQDTGHEWRITREIARDFGDGRLIKRETTEILEQGQNPQKPKKGSKFTKTIYSQGGDWLGEEVLHPDGHKSVNLPAGVKKLPEWF